MNTIKDKKIAIVGGGPGGLTLARLLQLAGAEVKVYERDLNEDVRVQGATLDLHAESGLKAIRQAGLMDEFKANYRPGADRTCIADQNGKVLLEDNEVGEGDLFRPEIDRGPLRKILLDSLQPDTVVWNSHFKAISAHGDSWKLKFQNSEAFADLVIAADGANSKLRPYMTPIKPFYAEVTLVEGSVYNAETVIPELYRLLKGGKVFAMGREQSLIMSSKGDGSISFYAGFKKEESWALESGIDFSDNAQVVAWFKEEYAGWDKLWHPLFENAAPGFIVRPQYCMPFDQSWEALPNLTMLGDAAHLMPPYAGEGVNMAMLDAVELCECLTNNSFSDLHSAIAAYEKQMRSRASEFAIITMESTAALHSPDAIAYLTQIIGPV